MSNNVTDYSVFDTMPTDYLRTLLSLDISATSGVELEPDAIMHILEVIQSRAADDGSAEAVDVAAAWKNFNEKYRPQESESESTVPICARPQNRKLTRLKRVCITIAAVIALAIGSQAVASASGFDLWGAVIQWASETFGLKSHYTYEDSSVPRSGPICEDLQDMLNLDGITEPLVPRWLPVGFTQQSCDKGSTPQMSSYQATYKNGDREITIQIFAYLGGAGAIETYEKMPGGHTAYTENGVIHQIAVNSDGSVVALWNTNNCECSILANVTETEMKQIIDSIYRG